MRRDATVISVDLQSSSIDGAERIACVELEQFSQCLRCNRGQGCGATNIASFFTNEADNEADNPAASPVLAKSNKLRLKVRIEQGASVEVGQQLKVDINDEQTGSSWLWAVFGAYGLPLAGMLIATGGASALWGAGGVVPASSFAELRILVSAGAGLFSGIVAWRLSSRRLLQISERGLCLLSVRIVSSVNELPTTPINIGSNTNE